MNVSLASGRPASPPLHYQRESRIGNDLKWIARLLQAPFYRITESAFHAFTSARFSSDHTYLTCLFFKVLGVSGLAVTSPLALIGSFFHAAGDRISGKSFTYIRGRSQEIPTPTSYKMLTLNACMLSGGLPYFFGGLPPARERIEGVSELIEHHDPDILLMQEMAHGPSVQLSHALRDNYAHFFMRIGPNPPLMESGLFVASKVPLLDAGFIPFNDQFKMIRGAFWIETENAVVFTAHLEHGEDEQDKRHSQLNQILEMMDTFDKPCYLLGDLNIDRLEGNQYQQAGIEMDFIDPLPEGVPTCSEALEAVMKGEPLPEKRNEQVDYALLRRGEQFDVECHTEIIETYEEDNPYTALSDHKGLLLTAVQ